jgi:hypothetical protein
LRLTGRRNARYVGPTSAISLLRTSTRASWVLLASSARAPAQWRRSTVFTTVRFASAGCTDLRSAGLTATGVFFPSPCVHALPLTPLSPLPGDTCRSRVHLTSESRQDRLQTARVNERPERRPGMPSIVRKPLPRNALSDTRLGPTPAPWFCHHGTGCRRLCYPLEPLRAPLSLGPRPRAPLPLKARFSEPRRRSPTSATDFDARTRRRAVDPRTRARFSPRYLPTTAPRSDDGCVGFMVRCRTRSLRAAICTRQLSLARSTCVDEAVHGPGHSRKANARS